MKTNREEKWKAFRLGGKSKTTAYTNNGSTNEKRHGQYIDTDMKFEKFQPSRTTYAVTLFWILERYMHRKHETDGPAGWRAKRASNQKHFLGLTNGQILYEVPHSWGKLWNYETSLELTRPRLTQSSLETGRNCDSWNENNRWMLNNITKKKNPNFSGAINQQANKWSAESEIGK